MPPLPSSPRSIVTGAGSGLGRAFSLQLAQRRARVLCVDLDLAHAEETARLVIDAGGQALAHRADVSRADEVEALAGAVDRAFGGVDLVVNNAGVGVSGPIGRVPLADWEWIVGVNLWGVIYGCHTFVPRFRASRAGHIINVASVAGLVASPEMGPYNVTKFGVVALSETLHSELAGTGVGVTVLCPTFFRTNIMRAGHMHSDDVSEQKVADLTESLMDRASKQAPDVARIALEAADRGRLYALPHADGRWAWRLKRLIPETLHGVVLPRVMAAARRRMAK